MNVKGKCEGCGWDGDLNWHTKAKKFLCEVCHHIASNL